MSKQATPAPSQSNNVTEQSSNSFRQCCNAILFDNNSDETYSSLTPQLSNAGNSAVCEAFAYSSESQTNCRPTEQLTWRGKQAIASSEQN